MKWLGQKTRKKETRALANASHRVTQDLARAEKLAAMVAASRASNVIDVADLLAGMYIYDWERLEKYWKDPQKVENFLQQICRISPQRWHFWMENFDRKQHGDVRPGRRRMLRRKRKDGANGEQAVMQSTELRSILTRAEEIAPYHDEVEGRRIPILTCECVLVCMAQQPESDLAERLVASGLDVGELEKSARFPKHAPLKGTGE
jgi:hypothetical protein